MKNTHQTATAVAATYYDSVPNRRLSAHFSLREFVMSAAAVRHNLPNLPDSDTERRLKALCDNVLEPLRRRFGRILITSGYRSPKVNALVGGVPTSQHVRGEAADLFIPSNEVGERMFAYIQANLPFDQLIFERNRKSGTRWLHVSYCEDRKCRHQAFRMEK